MRIALTGTPGTGKTTVASRLDIDLDVIHLGELIDAEGLQQGRDGVRDTVIVDEERLRRHVTDLTDVLFESHLAHRLDVDRVIVLRCHPSELEQRLRSRGVRERSIQENAQSEALDVILVEAVQRHGEQCIVEIDTTGRTIDEVVDAVEAAVDGVGLGTVGIVDFTGYIHDG